jgi:deoxyribodipyrimidine photo-lyase
MKTVNPNRIRLLKKGVPGKGPVVYGMSRDQRVQDNWVLIYSLQIAEEYSKGLIVAFALSPVFQEACIRQYDFMLKGLEEISSQVEKHNIPFLIIPGEPPDPINELVARYNVSCMVTDFDPLVKTGHSLSGLFLGRSGL